MWLSWQAHPMSTRALRRYRMASGMRHSPSWENPDRGFGFRGSPFGADEFDYWPFWRTGLRYEDVFTGFVFFKPLSEHRLCEGLPGLADQHFEEEILRRCQAVG